MRLEPEMWDGLEEICCREKRNVHEICSLVDARRRSSSLTAAMRVFILGYFRAAVTEQGHAMVGHGTTPPPDEGYAYPLRQQPAASG
jgi:predicted DNA-binding ribbon-helix-helix protein